MRTPMNAIIGFSSPEMLESADLAQMRDYMGKIHASGSYLLTLINEVLDMTKIESQRMELHEAPVTLREVLSDILPIIEEIADKKDVCFQLEADETDDRIYADRSPLSQILMNLLSNAVKFTESGGFVRLAVSRIARDADSVAYQICVQDNGCGMSEEFQQRMYEPFSQESSSRGGTGLGLAIASQMVELMGGTMSCESRQGAGTTFTIRIAFRSAAAAAVTPALPEGSSPEADPVDLAGRQILLCEDHPLNAQIAKILLERRGISVETACDGAQGVRLFELSQPGFFDLILMDIRMPEMNGLEAAKAIRALNRPDARNIPIIAMTANAFAEDIAQSQRAGMNAHLSKPIDPKLLYTTLEKYLAPQKTEGEDPPAP
ncbi:MAG: ATP-binding protein [Oscillospiraceae bacterium]|nr:ATP-binding protein [Oscillospiraceae bacterium]